MFIADRLLPPFGPGQRAWPLASVLAGTIKAVDRAMCIAVGVTVVFPYTRMTRYPGQDHHWRRLVLYYKGGRPAVFWRAPVISRLCRGVSWSSGAGVSG